MYESSQRMGEVWGWRGVLGQIAPSVFGMMGEYFYQVVPEGVGLMVVTLGINEPASDAEVDSALAGVEKAAKQLAQGNPDFICLSGLPLSMGKNFGFDQEIIKRIEEITGIPTTTTITSSIEALCALSIKKLVFANPSLPGLKRHVKDYLEASGFQVIHMGGPELAKNSEKRKLPMYAPYAAAKKAYLEAPEADGIYISCGSWASGPALVESLEKDLGKPVVTGGQAFIWAGLKALKIKPDKPFGRLFQTL